MRRANYGGSPRLKVDGRPLARSYVGFNVNNRSGRPTQITLLLYSFTRSRLGYQVRLVTRAWTERLITFGNAPRVSSRFISSGPLRAEAWKAVNVTSLVGEPGGQVSFALTTVGTQAIEFASRESGLRGPRLVVERKVPAPTTPALARQPG